MILIIEYYLVIGRIGYHCWIIWKRNLVNLISLPVLDTKMNGWGLGDTPQNLYSIVFIDVQLMQKDNKCNISYIAYHQWWKKT